MEQNSVHNKYYGSLTYKQLCKIISLFLISFFLWGRGSKQVYYMGQNMIISSSGMPWENM